MMQDAADSLQNKCFSPVWVVFLTKRQDYDGTHT